MSRYAIHTLINNGTVNLDFVERQYSLNDGEIIVGKTADFPVSRSIQQLLDFDKFILSGAHSFSSNFIAKPTASFDFNLAQWISDSFSFGSSAGNSGFSFVADAIFHFNHYFHDKTSKLTLHYAGSLFKRLVFSVFRTQVSAAPFHADPPVTLFSKGSWVEFDSSSSPYQGVKSSGLLMPEAFPVSMFLITESLPVQLFLRFEIALRQHVGFSPLPDYSVNVQLKLFSYRFSQDDHSIELV